MYNVYKEQFIKAKKEQYLSVHSIKAYMQDLNSFQKYLLSQNLDVPTSESFTDYQKYLATIYKTSSIKRTQITLKMFFSFLQRIKVIDDSDKLTLIPLKREKKLPKVIKINEIDILLRCVYNSKSNSKFQNKIKIRDILLLEFLISTGIRINEASQMLLSDIKSHESILIHGKGNKERYIYLSSDDTQIALKNYLNIRNQFHPQTNHLFLNKYGNQLSIYGIENIFYKYRNLSKVNSSSTPHYLRHTFATELLNNGASIRDVQELLGHSSITTTQIYTEVSTSRKEAVLNKYNFRNKIKTSK